MEALTLSGAGLAVAVAMGILFALFGGAVWWFFILGMLLFLVLSAAVTWLGSGYKRKKKLGQEPRGVRNVVANGLMPLVLAGLYRLSMALGAQNYAALCLFGFICAVAAITADKFASEIGILDGTPISLIGKKTVKKGVSGGVTMVGLAVSLAAALAVGVILVPLGGLGFQVGLYFAICAAALSGFLGNLVDSVLGYYEEKGIGNKFTSNFACSLAGAAIGIALLAFVL